MLKLNMEIVTPFYLLGGASFVILILSLRGSGGWESLDLLFRLCRELLTSDFTGTDYFKVRIKLSFKFIEDDFLTLKQKIFSIQTKWKFLKN